MQWKPNVTVAAIVERENRFLLVEEEADGLVVFNQPAGHLEENETLFDAVRREVLEETAWEYEPHSLVGVYMYPNPHQGITYLRFCFAGTAIRHHPDRELDREIIRTVWLDRDEVRELEDRLRSPMVLRCINDYLAGVQHPLELLHHYLEKT